MLSSRAKYAVRAGLHLAERAGAGGWVSTAEIAQGETIPRKFLEAILVEMRTHGLLESRRGSRGGHRLRLAPQHIAVADIIRIVDGPLALTPCASRSQFRACADCPDLQSCRIRGLMQRARDAVAAVLEQCSLADLVGYPHLEECRRVAELLFPLLRRRQHARAERSAAAPAGNGGPFGEVATDSNGSGIRRAAG